MARKKSIERNANCDNKVTLRARRREEGLDGADGAQLQFQPLCSVHSDARI